MKKVKKTNNNNVVNNNLKGEYISLMTNLLNKKQIKIENKMEDYISYLYEHNDRDKFIILLNDLYESFDDDNNKDYIKKLFIENSIEDLNNISTYKLCPYKNKSILDIVVKKEKGKNIEYNNFTTDYTCKKCNGNKVTTKFIHKRLGLDEATSTIATCILCGNSWTI